MSSDKLVVGMLNVCKQQWVANSVEITLPWYAIGREGSSQKLKVGKLSLTENSHFSYKPSMLSYRKNSKRVS